MAASLSRRLMARCPRARAYATASPVPAPAPAPARRTVRAAHALAGALALGGAAYLAGALAPPPPALALLSPRAAPPPPPAASPAGAAHTARIEAALQGLEVLRRARAADDADEWYEARPYAAMPAARRANNFTAGALRGPGMIAVPPLVRARRDETEAWVVVHLGRGVCGHDGIVHGGLLATLLDEGCARNAVLNMPSHVVVTANLTLDYKAPTRADQFVVMKTRLVELKGRKAVVEGRIEDVHGTLLAQARALFIEPKAAAALNVAVVQSVFPTVRTRVAAMTGRAAAEGGAEGGAEAAKGA